MEQLKKVLETMNIATSDMLLRKFENYMEQILSWNEKVNMTGITSRDDFIKKHFIDSVLCANRNEVLRAKHVIDIGTGAGFPGVPLALLFPEKKFTLVDSLNKKIKIVNEICESIEIPNVVLIHGRAEELAGNPIYRERFDLCVSRAVAKLSVLSEYCLPFVRPGGHFLSYKGSNIAEEIDEARGAIGILGGKVSEQVRTVMEGLEFEHSLLFIEKVKKTPAKYPRKAGTPLKEPLK